jgi:hypothetical protein
MKSHSLLVPGALSALASVLVLAGCATNRMAHYDQSSLQTSPQSAELLKSRIRNWSAPDDHTLIIEAHDGTRYKAETMGPCQGLGFSTRVGFASRGGFNQIDRFSSLVLPDGTRCALQSFNKVLTPEGSALDSFEKSGKSNKSDSGTTPQ